MLQFAKRSIKVKSQVVTRDRWKLRSRCRQMRPRLPEVSPCRFESCQFDLTVSLISFCRLGLRESGEEMARTVEFCDCEGRITCLNCGLSQAVSCERLYEALRAQSDGRDRFPRQNKREVPLLAFLSMEAQIRIKLVSTYRRVNTIPIEPQPFSVERRGGGCVPLVSV